MDTEFSLEDLLNTIMGDEGKSKEFVLSAYLDDDDIFYAKRYMK